MKKIRSVLPLVLVSIPLSLGAIAAACGSYVASEGNTGGTGGGGATGGTSGGDAGGGNSTSVPATPPCDLFEAAGHPCVSAHSTVRVLRSAYSGPLYQLCKGAARAGPSSCQGETLDIGVVEGGYADAAAHAAFCGSAQCTITKLYDQAAHESGPQNDLEPAPPGGNKPSPGDPVNAMNLPVTINGHEAYGMLFRPGMGYRTGCNDCNVKTGNGTAVGDEPESMYMVTSQHDTINGCCFDYGNAETTCNDGWASFGALVAGRARGSWQTSKTVCMPAGRTVKTRISRPTRPSNTISSRRWSWAIRETRTPEQAGLRSMAAMQHPAP
jgi:hypothetical protein